MRWAAADTTRSMRSMAETAGREPREQPRDAPRRGRARPPGRGEARRVARDRMISASLPLRLLVQRSAADAPAPRGWSAAGGNRAALPAGCCAGRTPSVTPRREVAQCRKGAPRPVRMSAKVPRELRPAPTRPSTRRPPRLLPHPRRPPRSAVRPARNPPATATGNTGDAARTSSVGEPPAPQDRFPLSTGGGLPVFSPGWVLALSPLPPGEGLQLSPAWNPPARALAPSG